MCGALVVLQATPYQVLALAIMLAVIWFMMPRAAGTPRVWGFDEKGGYWEMGGHQPH